MTAIRDFAVKRCTAINREIALKRDMPREETER